MSLLNVCSLINNLNSQAEETGEFHEEELITRRKFPAALDGFSLEAMLSDIPAPKNLSQQGLSTLGGKTKKNMNMIMVILVNSHLY